MIKGSTILTALTASNVDKESGAPIPLALRVPGFLLVQSDLRYTLLRAMVHPQTHPRSRTCTGSPMATSAARSSGSFVLPLLSVVDRALSSARSAAPSSLAALRSTLLADWQTEAAGIMRSGRMLHSCKASTTIVAASALHAHEEGAVDITPVEGRGSLRSLTLQEVRSRWPHP